MRAVAGWIGRRALRTLGRTGAFALLTARITVATAVDPLRGKKVRWRAALGEMVETGWKAVPVVGLIAFFMGVVLALQGAYQLEKFGAQVLVVNLVAITVTREMGPLLTAVVVAGRSGSAFAAEIGSMKVAEEIDALRTMGLHPLRFLAAPKLIALSVMLPCLTLIADMLGIVGGATVSSAVLGIGAERFAERAADALVMRDIVTGLVKSFVFAGIVTQVGCYYGFSVRGGAEEVGRAATSSVVSSIFWIIVADVIFTGIFYAL
jgi:phospholipid/cholesterol/gamma-HCH transport system permease protein